MADEVAAPSERRNTLRHAAIASCATIAAQRPVKMMACRTRLKVVIQLAGDRSVVLSPKPLPPVEERSEPEPDDSRRSRFLVEAGEVVAPPYRVHEDGLACVILPLLEAWGAVRRRAAELGRSLLAGAQRSQACQRLMAIPGIGAITATAFVTAIEDPANIRSSCSVAAWFGLTTRRYQSGEVDYDGHIFRRGDAHMRGLLYEAATVLLTRSRMHSDLRA